MDEFATMLESAGLVNVATIIQSGNVVYDADSDQAATIAQVLKSSFQLEVPLFTYSLTELQSIVRDYPYDHTDDTFQHNIVLGKLFDAAGFAASVEPSEQDHIAVGPNCMYWQVVKGFSTESNVAKSLQTAQYKTLHTVRNVATLGKVLEA